jgi:flagellar hook-basal body complex protein FliE
MEIRSVALPTLAPTSAATPSPTAASAMSSFGQAFSDAVGSIERMRGESDNLTAALAAGQNVDLHEVMLSVEQANLATQLAMQVRNKLIEAYQEVSRMQV